MRKEIKTLFIFISSIASICIIAGGILSIKSYVFPQSDQTQGCSPAPIAISEKNLIGTWMAGVPDHSDTLIIKSDGTYKQIVSIIFANGQTIEYESDWQDWYLEFSNNSITYIHLKNYAFCGVNDEISCNVRNGGGHDFCEDEHITMDGEGILLVLATPSGAYINLHYPFGVDNSYTYSLAE